MAQAGTGKAKQVLGNTAGIHKIAHEQEKWNGHQSYAADLVKHPLRQRHHVGHRGLSQRKIGAYGNQGHTARGGYANEQHRQYRNKHNKHNHGGNLTLLSAVKMPRSAANSAGGLLTVIQALSEAAFAAAIRLSSSS